MKNVNPHCAVIIVTHNSQLHLPKAMLCLQQQSRPADQVVLVDSGSADPSHLMTYQQDPKVTVVLAKGDIGFCRGNNIGMGRLSSNCDYVFFLNPDAFLTPRFLEDAIAFMEQPHNQAYAALTGKILGYDIQQDRPTGKYDTTGVFRKWYGRWYDRGQGMDCNPELYLNQEDIPAICGAVFFCRKKALDAVLIRGNEAFDNNFYMYKEDIDLSIRLRKNGGKLAYLPHLSAYHCRGWNPDRSKMPRNFRLASARNELRIHLRSFSLAGSIYSSLKYASVRFLDL